MAESFPMNGGDGIYSYAKNSKYQREASSVAKGMIEEAILQKLDIHTLTSNSGKFCIVDLGCSVGPNTVFTVEHVIETVKKKCSLHDFKTLEFQVFFNDSITNDFNSLFSLIPPETQYYISATPGSFHGRLFPRSSIHFAHSSYAIHWLSRVPEGLLDRNSSAWNGGRIYYSGAPIAVVDVYMDQFEKDLGAFLGARAEEIVVGGLMVLILPGIPSPDRHSDNPGGLFNFLGSILMDMANEGILDKSKVDMLQGILDKSKVDTFNLLIYAPTINEMKNVIEKNGCFSIEVIEVNDPRTEIDYHTLIMHLRAGLEQIFSKHFGREIVDQMFDRTFDRKEEITQFLASCNLKDAQLSVVLKRK